MTSTSVLVPPLPWFVTSCPPIRINLSFKSRRHAGTCGFIAYERVDQDQELPIGDVRLGDIDRRAVTPGAAPGDPLGTRCSHANLIPSPAALSDGVHGRSDGLIEALS